MNRGWRLRAACAGQENLFFAVDGEGKKGCREREDRARALCAACPVRDDCLDWALPRHVLGIWGGLNEAERAALAAEQGFPRLCAAETHVMAGDNVYLNPNGFLVCRPCRNEQDRRARARKALVRRERERKVAA